jgi:hypothetical protein
MVPHSLHGLNTAVSHLGNRLAMQPLGELEEGPEQKWALLATVYILHGLDPTAHHAQIVSTLRKLAEIDPNRRG